MEDKKKETTNEMHTDFYWILTLLFMMAFSGTGPDIKTKEDIAELKGKVSVLEKLV